MKRETDVDLGGVVISKQALSKHTETTLIIAAVAQKSLKYFRKYLNFANNIEIRVTAIKGKNDGQCMDTGRLIELDCRMSWDKALEILAHELIHAEQYHEGRLVMDYDLYGAGWVHYWCGEKGSKEDPRRGSKGTTYNSYRNQPWEIEAWSRQAELAEKVCNDLDKEYDND